MTYHQELKVPFPFIRLSLANLAWVKDNLDSTAKKDG